MLGRCPKALIIFDHLEPTTWNVEVGPSRLFEGMLHAKLQLPNCGHSCAASPGVLTKWAEHPRQKNGVNFVRLCQLPDPLGKSTCLFGINACKGKTMRGEVSLKLPVVDTCRLKNRQRDLGFTKPVQKSPEARLIVAEDLMLPPRQPVCIQSCL